jgi:penicillin-binding protein 2
MFNFIKRKRFSHDIEPNEVLIDNLANKKEKELDLSEKRLEVPIHRSLNFIFALSFFLVGALYFKAINLQILHHKELSELSNKNQFTFYKIKAQRGVIYDRNLKQLVFNKTVFHLTCDKNKLPTDPLQKAQIIQLLSQIFNQDPNFLKEKLEKESIQFKNISYQNLFLIETQPELFKGCEISQETKREYLDGENFSHVIGYLGKVTKEEIEKDPEMYSLLDYSGKSGIEAFYEEILRKIPGKLKIEKDALGRTISQEIISSPKPGKSIVLTIDSNLQKKIKELLEKRLKEVNGERAAAVALDPSNGEILALVSLPSFDNNIFSDADPEKISALFRDPKNPLFNLAISGEFLVGSIIKPIIAIGALEEKVINPYQKIDCHGEIVIPNPWNPDNPTIKKDWKAHGITDLKKAIAESCNVYFYTIGGGYPGYQGLGVEKIKKYLKIFNWGEKTGIDLLGEKEGLIPDPQWKLEKFKEPWRDGDTLNLSIGQGFVLATPLQVAVSFSAIANGGKIFQPHLLKQIIDDSIFPPQVLYEFTPKILKENFVSQNSIEEVRKGMRAAVTGENAPSATAILLNSLSISSAAKTGTAEIVKKGEKTYNNWIVVFAPYENPKIVLVIVISGVRAREVESQLIVVPVAKDILEWYFSGEK